MSASAAKNAATNAQGTDDQNRKLDYIAKAIYELARTIGDIEEDVRRIKNKTAS